MDVEEKVEELENKDQVEVEGDKLQQEEDISKLDLTEPEHLTRFKASYSGYKTKTSELEQEVTGLKTELDDIRANRDRGIFLDTNVPLEEYNPEEALDRMIQEEPDYYEKIADTIMDAHFWPETTTRFTEAIANPNLSPDKEEDRQILEQVEAVYTVYTEKLYGLKPAYVYGILDIISKTPELQDAIKSISNGQPYQFGNQSQQVPSGVETVEAIALRLNLDPSEEVHLNLIKGIQSDQRKKVTSQSIQQPQFNNNNNQQDDPRIAAVRTQFETTIKGMQTELDRLKNEKTTRESTSSEELNKQAETRFTTQSTEKLVSDIETYYANAIPKDKPQLKQKLKTLVESRLKDDPAYQEASRRVKGWFKQAAGASNPDNRDKYDRRGIEALAAMTPIRLRILHEEAKDLIGPVKLQADRKQQQRQNLPRANEIPGGGNIPPRVESKKAPVGDMDAARANIRKAAQARGLLSSR